MLVRNTSDFFHAAVHTSRRPPQPDMVLIVKGTFRLVKNGVVEPVDELEQAFLCGPQYADEDEERSGALLHPNDFADMKLRGEVLLMGSAYAPHPNTKSCPVRLTVGSWKKELMVHGDRVWKRGLSGSKIGEPQPVERLPLDFAHAFGGPEYAENPVGRGHGDDRRLPNVEVVGEPLLERGDKPAPGSFAPVNSAWPQRKCYLGTQYDQQYQKERAPYYSADHDWRYFSAGLADQQIAGYWRGDEEVVLQNLHPDDPVFKTQLPGLCLRAFVKDETGAIRSVGMVLDTILFEPDDGTVKLTWRGLTEVRDDDLADVSFVYIAVESLADDPLPDEHYHQALEAWAADPTGVLSALPKELFDEYERQQKIRRGEPVPERELPEGLDPVQRKIKSEFGPLVSDEQLATIGSSMAQVDQLDLPDGLDKPDLTEALDKLDDKPKKAPPATMIKPGRMPDTGLRQQMREIMNQVETMREAERKATADVAEHAEYFKDDEAEKRKDAIAQLAAIPHREEWKQLDPEYEPPGPLSDDEPGPGADLREHDLSGQDLHGIDLSGANLERTNLCSADLRGANLQGANLRWAQLYLTELGGADLRGANLELANCICVHADGADFTGATMSEACFEGAWLNGASLDEVTAEYVVFEGAKMHEVTAHKAHFDHSDFTQAELHQAKLRGASAVRCNFGETKAPGLDLMNATLDQSSFVQADLTGGNFIGSKVPRGFFMKATLDEADFGHADLSEAHLTEASAKATRFFGTDLREARLYRTNLEAAQLVEANLAEVDARKARIEQTSFARSNLYEAKLLDVRGKGYDLTEANLIKARVEPNKR